MGSGSNVPRVPNPPTMMAPPARDIDTGVLDIALSRRQPKRSGYITKGQTIGDSGELIKAPKREMASVKDAVGQAALSEKAELKNLEEFNPAGFAQLVSMYRGKNRARAAEYLRSYRPGSGDRDPFRKSGRSARAQKYRERQLYKSRLFNQYNEYAEDYRESQIRREKEQGKDVDLILSIDRFSPELNAAITKARNSGRSTYVRRRAVKKAIEARRAAYDRYVQSFK